MSRIVLLIMGLVLSISARAQYDVVPLPQNIQIQKGEPFLLSNDQVQILAPETLMGEAVFLQAYLKDVTGQVFSIAPKREKRKTYIELAISPNVTESEGYVLTINKKGVTIAGGSAAGVFYGIQTLRKSLASIDKATSSIILLPSSIITDAPRFSWRGMHLDCSRHFWSVDFVKKFIDLLALHNMNVFHWHLTDDQGWRIEIK